MTSADDDFRRERMIDSVSRRVMWGDRDEDILQSLAAKGLTNDEAVRILGEAQWERIRAIRAVYWPRIWWGLLFIAVGIALIWLIWTLTEGYTVWSSRAVILPAGPAAFGLWKLCGGLVGVLTAGSRTGSIAEIE